MVQQSLDNAAHLGLLQPPRLNQIDHLKLKSIQLRSPGPTSLSPVMVEKEKREASLLIIPVDKQTENKRRKIESYIMQIYVLFK